MSQSEQQKCKHQGCQCEAPSGKDYCSEHCEQAAKGLGNPPQGMQQRCGCGHSGCA